MRLAERPVAVVDHLDDIARLRFASFEDIAQENPGMTAQNPVGSFAIDADGRYQKVCVPQNARGADFRSAPLAASKRFDPILVISPSPSHRGEYQATFSAIDFACKNSSR